MRKHIRVVTPIITKGFRKFDDLKAIEDEQIELSLVEIDRGPASIECETDEMLAAPDTVRCIIEAERQGCHAVVIDCMGDPGLKAGRECVQIPVLGPAQTSMHLAAMLGHRFGVLTVLQRLRTQFEDAAKLYGVAEKLAAVRAVDIPVLALEEHPETTRDLLIEQARLAVEVDAADVIIFGCTGMLGYAAAVREGLLAAGYDVPVIDPIPATVRIAVALVGSGLGHSKLCYPAPPLKDIVGFDRLTRAAAPR